MTACPPAQSLDPGSRVYVASAGVNRDAARACAASLVSAGHVVVSTWHEAAPFDSANDGALSDLTRRTLAATCLREIDGADALVIAGHPAARGALFEAGYAYGVGKRVLWHADRTSIFAALFATR